MRFTAAIILTAILSFVACIFLPWWSIAISAFAIAVIVSQNPFKSFLCGFIALFVLWAGLSFWISHNNGNLLAYRMSEVFFRSGSPYVIIFITGLTGGLVAGFAALAGSYVRKKTN